MAAYRQLLDDIFRQQAQKQGNKHRKALLSPTPLSQPQDLVKLLTPCKRYVGPSLWYAVLKSTEN